jgi:hypothetical protein
MTKKENISYQRKVSDITDGLMLDAYRTALGEVDRIHRDILLSLREKIDAWFAEHPNSGDGGGTYHPKK